MRHERVVRTKAMPFLKPKSLVKTTADDLLSALDLGTNSTMAFLQPTHNGALGMGWIPAPILPRKLWPKMKNKNERAITDSARLKLRNICVLLAGHNRPVHEVLPLKREVISE